MEGLVSLAKSILGPEPGISLLLFVLCGLALWAYWREKQKNDEVADQRLEEARQDVKMVTEALNAATAAVHEFKESNASLKTALESLANTAKNGHDTVQVLVSKLK